MRSHPPRRCPQGAGYDAGAYEAPPSISVSLTAAASAIDRLPSNGVAYFEAFTILNSGPGASAYVLDASASGSAVVIDSIRGPGLTFGAAPDSALTSSLVANGGSVGVSVFYTVTDVAAGTTDPITLRATSVTAPAGGGTAPETKTVGVLN